MAVQQHCRLCWAVVPPELGYLYADELTDYELDHLCEQHWEGLENYPGQ